MISVSWVCLGRGEGLTFGLAHVQDFFSSGFRTGSLFGLGWSRDTMVWVLGIFISQKGIQSPSVHFQVGNGESTSCEHAVIEETLRSRPVPVLF